MTDNSGARRVLVLTAITALCVLGACQRDGGASAPATDTGPQSKKLQATAGSRPDAAVADANRNMAAGVPLGESTAPVEVRFELGTAPVAGEPFDVSVAVLPGAPAPVLHIEVRASEGLIVVAPDGPVSIEKVEAGSVERLTVKASSAKTGTRVLSVKVTLELPTGAQSRDFAFPLLVGGGTAEPVPARAKDTG